MSDVTAALPRKSLTQVERELLRQGNRLLLDKPNGRIGAAALMDLVTDWVCSRATTGLLQFGPAWIAQGGAKNKIADKLLRELFGMDEPTPRKAA
ncbi:hypothetical protein HBO12_25675 [Pseudomonas sp. WS 5059]|uniref:hypothetical protein n=1 Tax=Pseudomonas sp. WS 5059 TaxID=2717491 RepID=UPI0014752CE6|nr:hypothetical protein [Pseudomonas sp. WS 5059]NMY06351.1 hypothetical protein [Pseudomonas sp. WS 5059]